MISISVFFICSCRAGTRHKIRTIAVCETGLDASFDVAVTLMTEIRDSVLKVDSLAAAQSTSIFPSICSRDKLFPGVNTP